MAKTKKKIVHVLDIDKKRTICGQREYTTPPIGFWNIVKELPSISEVRSHLVSNERLCHKCKYILKNKTKSFNKTGKQNVN
jgi:hypothetical protein